MSKFLPLAILSLALCAGCNIVFNSGPRIPGSGIIEVQNRELGQFSSIAFSGAGTITYEAAADAKCEIEVDDNLQSHVETTVVNGVLKIECVGNIQPTSGLLVRLSSESLNGCSIAGSSKFTGTGIASDSFDLDIAGSGKVSLSGTAKKIDISISGAGSVDSNSLVSNDVGVSIAGAGNVNVNAVENLDVSISGSGKVIYSGEPTVTQSVAGSGTIQKAE